jgi:hypothetical protein
VSTAGGTVAVTRTVGVLPTGGCSLETLWLSTNPSADHR